MVECDWGDCATDAATHVNLPFASPAVCNTHARTIRNKWVGETL